MAPRMAVLSDGGVAVIGEDLAVSQDVMKNVLLLPPTSDGY